MSSFSARLRWLLSRRRTGLHWLLLAMCLLLAPVRVVAQAPDTYRLGSGDLLRITVHRRADLSGTYRIGPAGSFSMPLLGRIEAAGKDAQSLEKLISEAIGRHGGSNGSVASVEIAEFRPVFVIGDVAAPGRYPFIHGMTVIHAIALAGGFRPIRQEDLAVRLELHRVRENYRSLTEDLGATLAREARLLVEQAEGTEIQFPSELNSVLSPDRRAQVVAVETRLFTSRSEALKSQIAALRSNQSVLQKEIDALQAQISAEDERAKLLYEEIESFDSASRTTVVPRRVVLSLSREATGIAANRQGALALVARTQAEMGKVDKEILGLVNNRRIEIESELGEVRNHISRLRIQISAARSVLSESRGWLPARAASAASVSNALATIVRWADPKPRELSADELTLLQPGDVVRIPVRQSRSLGNPASTQPDPSDEGSS